jgi:hypothetical protein
MKPISVFAPVALFLVSAIYAPIYPASFSKKPTTGRAPQLCQDDTVMLILAQMQREAKDRNAGNQDSPQTDDVVNAVCKPNPGNSAEIIAAVVYDQKPDADGAVPNAVELALVDAKRKRIVALGDAKIFGGGPSARIDEASLWIDTAPYDLAPGVRAFGVETMDGYSPNCGDGVPGPSRNLYIRDGGSIRPVLQGLAMSHQWIIQRGADRCGAATSTDAKSVVESAGLSISLANTSSNNYRDLWLTADFSIDDEGLSRSFRYKLQYDGKEYPLAAFESAYALAEHAFMKTAATRLGLKVPF